MIKNATLSNVATPGAADAWGKTTFTGAAVSVRVFLDEPTRAQRSAEDRRIAESDAVMYVEKPLSGFSLAAGCRVTAAVDGAAAITYEVRRVIDRQKDGGLSHVEAYLKVVQ